MSTPFEALRIVGTARLPTGADKFAESPVFTEATVPAALQKDHSTKDGTWALLVVQSGAIDYTIPAQNSTTTVRAGEAIVIEPQVVHNVSLTGPVRCQVEFYRERPTDGA